MHVLPYGTDSSFLLLCVVRNHDLQQRQWVWAQSLRSVCEDELKFGGSRMWREGDHIDLGHVDIVVTQCQRPNHLQHVVWLCKYLTKSTLKWLKGTKREYCAFIQCIVQQFDFKFKKLDISWHYFHSWPDKQFKIKQNWTTECEFILRECAPVWQKATVWSSERISVGLETGQAHKQDTHQL